MTKRGVFVFGQLLYVQMSTHAKAKCVNCNTESGASQIKYTYDS